MIIEPTPPVFRFAPSPNGYLHVGHAYSALKNEALARRCGGRLLVRIEDIDTGRARPAFEAAIFEDLAWLGIAWETPVRRQSEHVLDYARALAQLDDLGCLYPCFCTRSEIARAVADRAGWPRDPDGEPHYPGTCKALAPAEADKRIEGGQPASRRIDIQRAVSLCGGPIVWREYGEIDTPREAQADPNAWGDAVIARKDIATSYTIAVVVDDARQGVTDVVRGKDLFAATSLQRLLQDLLRLPPPEYHHHEVIRDEAGAKLSKSIASRSLRSLRAGGMTAEGLRHQLGFA